MKFSILVPAYKRQFLAECIESVLGQTYRDLELIIVDDDSPEDLRSVISNYEADERLRYFRNPHNCGAINVVDNWNICLAHARGDYSICMGDDDRLKPRCLEAYAALIDQYPGLGLYHAWTEIIDEQGRIVDLQEPRPQRESMWSMIWWRWHERKQYIGDFLFDTRRLKAEGGFLKLPMAWGSDDLSAFRAAQDGGVANSQEPLFQYRRSSQTISRSGHVAIKLEASIEEEQWYESLINSGPEPIRCAGSSGEEPLPGGGHLPRRDGPLCPSAPPQDPHDAVLRRLIESRLKVHMSKKRIYLMVACLRESMLKWLPYFLKHRKRFRLTLSHIAYATLETLKEKYMK